MINLRVTPMAKKRATANSPKTAATVSRAEPPKDQLNALIALYSQGRLAEVVQQAAALIAEFPGNPILYNILGAANAGLRNVEGAIENFKKALQINPDYAEAHNSLGIVLQSQGCFDEAIASYRKALQIRPDLVEAHNNLGTALKHQGRLDEAIASFGKALKIDPRFAESYNNLGTALKDQGRLTEAISSFGKALQLNPRFAEAHSGLGVALQEQDRPYEAITSFDRAISFNSGYVEAYLNRAIVQTELCLFDEAMASYDKALAVDPAYTSASWNRANLLLLLGKFEEGFRQYENRESLKKFRESRTFKQPVWSEGVGVSGKVLLICRELYLGDMIQFSRYAKLAEACGAKVIISAQDCLRELLQGLGPAIKIVPDKSQPEHFDYCVSLMSLPLIFGTVLETIPRQVPYLHADRARVNLWKKKLGDRGFKIGICWQGSKLSTDKKRSFPLSEFHNISQLPNVRLISLQKTDGLEQLAQMPAGMRVESLGDDFDAGEQAFLDTAAVMKSLDLVITCDTAIAHLAGALAIPTWVVLKQVPDWRWLLARSNSPWYPTVRLFRQTERGDWRTAFAQMEAALISKLG